VLSSITEKPEQATTNIINTGIYAFDREIFDCIGSELDVPEVINRKIQTGSVIRTEETQGTWLDIVHPWDILSVNASLLRNLSSAINGTVESGVTLKGSVAIGQGSVIRACSYLSGPLVIGQHCEIGPQSSLLGAISLGDNVTVGPFCYLNNCVIGNDVSIGSHSVLQDSVIDAGCVIQPRFTAVSAKNVTGIFGQEHEIDTGVVIGEGCILEPLVVAAPGTVIGNNSKVGANAKIQGFLPDGSLVF
jgi:glucose-1-phosphate thymidylyltransferase